MKTYRIPQLKIRMVRERRGVKLAGPNDAVNAVRQLCCDDPCVETMVVLFVDGLNQIRGATVIAQGGRDALGIKATEVFRPAIVAGAAGVILGHNHPSGSVAPSEADDRITRAIARAGDVLGLPLLDHMIVTDDPADGYYSYLDEGRVSS